MEALTDETDVADADRKSLLNTVAHMLAQVDDAECRIARKATVESQAEELEASRLALSAEVERLQKTNDAMCQQVLGEDGEGPFAGALAFAQLSRGDADEGIHGDIVRLVRGKPLMVSQGSVQQDASALALKLQQIIAEREEAFWVERQRLSDRVIDLERSRGGRTGALLREYEAVARGRGPGPGDGASGGAGGVSTGAAAAASAAVSGGLKKLRGTVLGST